MPDIEILEELEDKEFYESINREAVERDGQWVMRLTYRDGTVKHIRNEAVPTKTLAGEPFKEEQKDE